MSKQKNTLRQRLRDTAAEALLEAAERAMIKKGYEKATMAQIAAEAGCAAGTFYLYFKNKEELFQAIVARHSYALFETAKAAIDEVDDPLDKVRCSVERHLLYIHQHQPFFRLFFTAMPMRQRTLHTTLSPTVRQQHDDYNRMELEIIRQAQKKGQLRKDLSADLLQQFMQAVGISIVEEFLFSDSKKSVEEQTKIIWGLIASGLDARSRHERA